MILDQIKKNKPIEFDQLINMNAIIEKSRNSVRVDATNENNISDANMDIPKQYNTDIE